MALSGVIPTTVCGRIHVNPKALSGIIPNNCRWSDSCQLYSTVRYYPQQLYVVGFTSTLWHYPVLSPTTVCGRIHVNPMALSGIIPNNCMWSDSRQPHGTLRYYPQQLYVVRFMSFLWLYPILSINNCWG